MSEQTFHPDLIYVATSADRTALLLRAARDGTLPSCKCVDVSRFPATPAPDLLSRLHDHHGLDAQHAARVASVVAHAIGIPTPTESLELLEHLAAGLVAEGGLVPSDYRPDPRRLVLLNGVAPIPIDAYRDVPRVHLGAASSSPVRLVTCPDREAMLHAVIDEIATRLEGGAVPDDIVLVNATPADLRKLARIGMTYGFTIVDAERVRLDRLPLGRSFRDAVDDPEAAYRRLAADPKHADPLSQAALSVLRGILDRYAGSSLSRAILAVECAAATVPLPRRANVVRAIAADDLSAFSTGIHLVLDANEETLPGVAVDDDYLTDAEKLAIGLEPSSARNARLRDAVGHALAALADVVLFRPAVVGGAATRPTRILAGRRPIRQEDAPSVPRLVSADDGGLVYAKERHVASTFHQRTPLYAALTVLFEDGFTAYDPSFGTLSPKTAGRLRIPRVTLSATSLETFNRCRFRFLCDHLLHLNPTETSESQVIGSLAHDALHRNFADNVAIRDAVTTSPAFQNADPRLRLLLTLFAERLALVTERIRTRPSTLQDLALEKSYGYPIPRHPEFTVTGTIDRVAIAPREPEAFVFVIDYKTGNDGFSSDGFARGVDIQPVFYLHLLAHSPATEHLLPAGFYYQPLTLGRLPRQADGDPVGEALRLDGLTLAESAAVAAVGGIAALRGVRTKSDGTFFANSAVVDRSTLAEMIGRIDGFIAAAVAAVTAGAYPIDPESRRPGHESRSCEYCANRDICHTMDRIPVRAEQPETEVE